MITRHLRRSGCLGQMVHIGVLGFGSSGHAGPRVVGGQRVCLDASVGGEGGCEALHTFEVCEKSDGE